MEDDALGGAWLADLAANLLCVVLVVLTVAATTAPPPAAPARARVAAVLAGPDAVEMLRRRLLAPSGSGYVDLLAAGARSGGETGAGPVDVFVFDHATYLARPPGPGPERELSVPAALRAPSGDDWAPGFLALAPLAADREAFTTGLVALLTDPAATASPARRDAGRSLLERLTLWANAAMAALSAGLVTLVARRQTRRR